MTASQASVFVDRELSGGPLIDKGLTANPRDVERFALRERAVVVAAAGRPPAG